MLPGRREIGYLVLCFAAASCIPFLTPEAQARFAGFGFGAPPLLMLALATVAGTAALFALRRSAFFEAGRGLGIRTAVVSATILTGPAILADIGEPFPPDINADWPDAWLFYPAIGVVVVGVLKLAPLALTFATTRRAWIAVPAVALIEAALQVALDPGGSGTRLVFVGAQLFAFGVFELILLRRHGLAAMVGFRLTYYLWWHILWGQARLGLLFGGP